ncbi:hypothetical protein BJ170DRAFT_595659 [Xylariales sp. AK1849]|nr:hypothetical protein BJ170DRAFT_595659 [Xylariales sp. AK1849]
MVCHPFQPTVWLPVQYNTSPAYSISRNHHEVTVTLSSSVMNPTSRVPAARELETRQHICDQKSNPQPADIPCPTIPAVDLVHLQGQGSSVAQSSPGLHPDLQSKRGYFRSQQGTFITRIPHAGCNWAYSHGMNPCTMEYLCGRPELRMRQSPAPGVADDPTCVERHATQIRLFGNFSMSDVGKVVAAGRRFASPLYMVLHSHSEWGVKIKLMLSSPANSARISADLSYWFRCGGEDQDDGGVAASSVTGWRSRTRLWLYAHPIYTVAS